MNGISCEKTPKELDSKIISKTQIDAANKENNDMNFDQSDLPNIPGFRVSVDTRNKFHKSHLFDVCNGIPVTDLNRMSISCGKTPKELDNKIIPKTQIDVANKENKTGHINDRIPMSTLPRWVVFDRKVLRFYSYFTENVVNSAIEHERVRRCVIYYFLEDDTFMIDEIKTENSGIPQSTFLKRQQVPKHGTNGLKWLNYLDLIVGSTVIIYNRTFNIIDADSSTRKYLLDTNSIKLASPEVYPKDDYIKHFERREAFCKAAESSNNDIKSYVEARLGRVSSDRLAKSKKYLANDGKVLRFDGIWSDNSWKGRTNKYQILYFLADDTIQVSEYDDKTGKLAATLLSRQELPRKYIPTGCAFGIKHDKSAANNDCYKHNDLRIGGYLNIYGRDVLLTSADKFTKDFYIRVHNLTDSDFEEILQKKENSSTKKANSFLDQKPPPYNGFGTEEDSLGSWHSLIPRPPQKDYYKIMKYDGCCLRFLAKFTEKNTSLENYKRRFVIEFFLTDDNVTIYEKPSRNSGFVSGKFLERTKLKNELKNNKWFHAEDFYVGAQLKMNGFHFDLLETDKQTLDIINKNIEIFTRESPETILAALADKLYDKSINQTKTFREIDTDKDRYISPQEMKALCTKYGWNVNPNQLKSIFRYFDADDSGEISVDEFFKALNKYKLQKHIFPKK